MKHIKDKYIDIVKSRVDICQLVVDLCPGTVLKPSGPHRKKCCCVFHQEESPSLMLDTTMNRYKRLWLWEKRRCHFFRRGVTGRWIH